MKNIFILLTSLLISQIIFAEEHSVIIRIQSQTESYYIEVADRNCGAISNGVNHCGNYKDWNEAKIAAREFNGMQYTDWRLPNDIETEVILSKLKLISSYAILQNEVGDSTKVVYFPYGGYITSKKHRVKEQSETGYFWSSNSVNKRKAIVLELTESYYNNRVVKKKYKCNVRCVRTVKR